MDIHFALVMIVKNESKIIERCLSSVLSIIDTIIISDTGSTDNTIELIETFISKHQLKGKVYKDEWKNFGHNRSKSVTNAQEWLKENNYNMKQTYLLTIDADMIFKIKPTFSKQMLVMKDSWCIQQMNPNMTYYNKRIFRASLRHKCIGVTHEYWGCDDPEDIGKLQELYIDDIGDGGAKDDKFIRDIKLLTQGLVDEPKNERYFFYLAQSYSDFGEKEKAIEWYKKRIDIGGWNEEIFISHLRIGDIYSNLGQYENAIHYWGLGYDHLPSRSETLYRIINRYRILGKNQLCLMYLQTALKIVYPTDQVLFIEHPIYQYRLLEELSICGFYTPKKSEGFQACNYLLVSKNIPEQLKNLCYSNIFFYMKSLQKSSTKLIIKSDHPYINSSASFLKSKEGHYGIVRHVNYSITKQFQYIIRDEQQHVKTKNVWTHIDKKGSITKQYELMIDKTCIIKNKSHIVGLEDMRLCKIDDDYIALAVSFEYGNHNHPSVCLCILDKTKNNEYYISSIYPTNYKDTECQKNWAPFTMNHKLYAIYSHQPLTIVEIDKKSGNTSIHLQKESIFDLSNIRGSTSPVKMTDGSWMMIVHEVLHRDTRKYFHRFIWYTQEWELKEISVPFYFNELFVEFTLSISVTNDIITVFFSSIDNTTEMISISLGEIQWTFKDSMKWIQTNF